MATVTYKCPNCGGGLEFNPALQKYKCEYCLSEVSQNELEALAPQEASDQILNDIPDGGAAYSEAVLYNCPSCGAEIVTDATTAATFCFYCHNPVVLAGRLEGSYHPDFVVPFGIDRKRAVQIFEEWIKKKKYIPSAFYSPAQMEKLSGVYFPYLLYSCQVDGSMDAEGIKLRTWNAGNIKYTETSKYDIRREGSMKIENVARNVLKKADRCLVEGVLPFDMKGMKPFTMGYLSGFAAEKRDMDKIDISQEVEREVETYAVDSLKSSAGIYDRISVRSSSAEIRNPLWKYALMPVWTLTYKDLSADKIYYFALNGQTGKICGELPVDKKKLLTLFLSVFLPMVFVLLIVGYLI